jgi:hypothetical protein
MPTNLPERQTRRDNPILIGIAAFVVAVALITAVVTIVPRFLADGTDYHVSTAQTGEPYSRTPVWR